MSLVESFLPKWASSIRMIGKVSQLFELSLLNDFGRVVLRFEQLPVVFQIRTVFPACPERSDDDARNGGQQVHESGQTIIQQPECNAASAFVPLSMICCPLSILLKPFRNP